MEAHSLRNGIAALLMTPPGSGAAFGPLCDEDPAPSHFVNRPGRRLRDHESCDLRSVRCPVSRVAGWVEPPDGALSMLGVSWARRGRNDSRSSRARWLAVPHPNSGVK